MGDQVTLTANFSDSQKGKVVTFYEETSPGSGDFESFGTKAANSSGNASLAGHSVDAEHQVFARTSAGKETEIDTLKPSAAPGGEGEINACFDRSDGDLNILIPPKSCTSSQKAISWNADAETADTGRAVLANTTDYQGFLAERKVVLSKEVPAGKYAVTATLQLQNRSNTDTHLGTCSLHQTSSPVGIGAFGFGIPVHNDEATSVLEIYGYTIIGVLDAGDGTTLELSCQANVENQRLSSSTPGFSRRASARSADVSRRGAGSG